MPEIASSAAPVADDTLLRGRLLWLVAAPASAAALLFAVTAGYLWAGGADRSDLVLIIAFLLGVVALVVAAGQAVATVRRIEDRSAPLRAEATEARAAADRAREQAEEARAEAAAARADLADARAESTAALTEAAGYRAAVADARAEIDALSERLRLAEERPVPVRTSAGRQVEVFVNLSRRLQSLVHREIKLLDALENEVEDPDLLKGLFQVDHLATRIRRHAENLAVLGGAVSRRQWSRPVALTEVLRSAIAEVEHYSRVKLVPPIEGTVPGHAVASIIHLVAELIENATMFAPPQTQVLLRAQHVTAGVVVEVEDRGLGMQREDQDRVNRLLLNPEDINLDELLRDGRIGLFVVSMIARQHGVTVQLQGNIYGGTQAVIILPQHLLGSAQEDREPAAFQSALTQNAMPPNALVPNALSQKTMELAQRVPGPSQIAAPPPTWPAFSASPAPGTPAFPSPALVSATPAPAPVAAPVSALPVSAAPTSAPGSASAPSSASAPGTAPAPGSAPAPSSPSAPGSSSAPPFPSSAAATSTPAPATAAASSLMSADAPGALPQSERYDSSVAPLSGSPVSGGVPAPDSGAAVPGSAVPTAAPAGPLGAPRPAGAEAVDGRSAATPPPLPRRHSQTHLAPQLQFGPPPPPTDDDEEHDPALMASFMQGVSRAQTGTPAPPHPSDQH